jgi:hypothetical protein
MASVITPERCDWLGFLSDYLFGRAASDKSVLIFKFFFVVNPVATCALSVQSTAPRLSRKMALPSCPVRDPGLTCYTDSKDSRSVLLLELEAPIESHPKMLRLAALTDLSLFDFARNSRRAVRLEFWLDAQTKTSFCGSEIVEFAVRLADTFAKLQLPAAVLWRIQTQRRRTLRDQKTKTWNMNSKRGILPKCVKDICCALTLP